MTSADNHIDKWTADGRLKTGLIALAVGFLVGIIFASSWSSGV